ncbi:MAG: hypothetical protein ACRDTK_04520 [Mycobacterium sp.]
MTALAAIRAAVGPEYLNVRADGLGTAPRAIRAAVGFEYLEYVMLAEDGVTR